MRRNDSISIRLKNFLQFLICLNLDGIIEEAIIKFDGKKIYTEAVDLTNNLIIVSSMQVLKQKTKEMELGFGNLGILIKFLKTVNEPIINMMQKKNRLTFIRKDKRRQMKYFLSEPSTIATVVEKESSDEDIEKGFKDLQQCKINLTPETIKDFRSYVSLSKSKIVKAKKKSTEIEIVIGSDIENQFSLIIENELEEIEESGKFEVQVNGEFMDKIFSVIDFDEDNPPVLWLGEEQPLLITTHDTMWALLPKAEGEE